LPELPLTWLDVFTDVPLAGNALAVVHDADGVGDDTMHRFACETRLSETSFVQAPAADGADYRNRIWTMDGEIAFAGHPSLGVAVAVARLRGEREVTYMQETGAGVQPVEVTLEGDPARASMLQEPAVFGPEVDPARLAEIAGLSVDQLDPEFTPQVVSTGLPHIMAPVRHGALATAAPRPELRALLKELGCVVLYLVEPDLPRGAAQARSFMIVPEGVGEDPATGSAVGPLCAYLAERTGTTRIVVEQGVEMRRRSVLEAELDGDRVRVSGDVVFVAEGTVAL
jgi:trans-2,3-dihydro-3-hydroxyanthranilate isomerase